MNVLVITTAVKRFIIRLVLKYIYTTVLQLS